MSRKTFIEEVFFHQQNDTGWYIPHYGLDNPNKSKKIPRICNAIAPQSGISHNYKLLAGPDLLGNMLGILQRFRQGAIAVHGDIKAMFMQTRLQQKRPTLSAIHVEAFKQPKTRGVRIPKTLFWSQGFINLRIFCFATDSQRRLRKKLKFAGDDLGDILIG